MQQDWPPQTTHWLELRRQARQREKRQRLRRNHLLGLAVLASFSLAIWLLCMALSQTPNPAPVAAPSMPTSTAETMISAPRDNETRTDDVPGENGLFATPTAVAPTVPSSFPTVSFSPSGPSEKILLGQSLQGRPITAHRFGLGDVRILIIGGVHGDEHGTDVAEGLVSRLLQDPDLLPAGREVHVIPCLNPDGRAASTRANAAGVDLNRNMPTHNWSGRLQDGDYSAKLRLSGGSNPGSEPETKIVLEYLEIGFDLVISLHSRGGFIDFDGPGAETVARRMSEISRLPLQHLEYQSHITGSMGQFIPERYGIPVITVELNGPELPEALLRSLLEAGP